MLPMTNSLFSRYRIQIRTTRNLSQRRYAKQKAESRSLVAVANTSLKYAAVEPSSVENRHHDASKTCRRGAKIAWYKELSYEATFNSIKNAILCSKSFSIDVHISYRNALSPSPWINSFCSHSNLFIFTTPSKCTS